MKIKFLLLFVWVFATCALSASAQTKAWPGVKDSLYSSTLKETRKIQVIFPTDYKPESGTKYEMFYVLDGEWYMEHVPFIYNFTVTAGFAPPCIFILLPNTYVNNVNRRDRDFSPTRISNDTITGGADKFHAFLKTELIPYIEKKYPANGNRSLIGSSFSGLFSVYAFIKDPDLFRSFIASDPNLNWDNNYVSKLAINKLPAFTNVKSTLFIGALETTQRQMGSHVMDSVLTKHAPSTLPWQFIAYPNETHYSVQHRAFYDGMRFSHLGFIQDAPETHPNNALMAEGKPLKLYLMNRNPAVKFTTDGTVPLINSEEMKPGEFLLEKPAILRMKSFPNRAEDAFESEGKYTAGSLAATKSPKPLQYKYYTGDWTTIPDLKKAKPSEAGKIEKDFKFDKISGQSGGVFVVDGTLDIQEEGYYIILVRRSAAVNFSIGGMPVIQTSGLKNMQSFGAYLKKGFYPVHAELLRLKSSPEMGFGLMHTTQASNNWWEHDYINY